MAPSSGVSVTPSGGVALALIGVQSRKTHGAAGSFDLPVDRAAGIGGTVTVEPRAIGSGHVLVFQFNAPVTSVAPVQAIDGTLNAVGTVASTISGSDVQVSLSGVPDNTRVQVTLTGVNDTGGAVVALGFLVGDINSSRSVNSSDVVGLKARSGQSTNVNNFRADVNVSGLINAADVSAVKSRAGWKLP